MYSNYYLIELKWRRVLEMSPKLKLKLLVGHHIQNVEVCKERRPRELLGEPLERSERLLESAAVEKTDGSVACGGRVLRLHPKRSVHLGECALILAAREGEEAPIQTHIDRGLRIRHDTLEALEAVNSRAQIPNLQMDPSKKIQQERSRRARGRSRRARGARIGSRIGSRSGEHRL